MAFATTAALSLGACSLNAKTAALNVEPELVTASVAKKAKAEGIDKTDAELINATVAHTEEIRTSDLMLAWSNPDTGNRGTIMAIDRFVGTKGEACKKFETTVDSFSGIAIYKGETCQMEKDRWVLSDFLRE